ncbi:M16 family metallopeptidase [Peterkaempfera bronchialis]|uniref:M16 family metallopeptidase n=1 Tax=Peterkaempfera bronchialis TaxID=2126346 RepID=UPI003C2C07C4
MTVSTAEVRTRHRLERHRLGNGLTVLLLPDPEVSAVGVTVSYDVGYRTEARSGFAHLFEHLMFQGSASLPKLAHAQHIQAAGGAFNGATHRDHTAYYQVVPAEALELVLFLEADRMRSPRITQENIDNQVAVVAEEIRRNILGRPYGGFPAFQLPELLFTRHANTHNGYGDFASLADVEVAECEEFFDRHYAPGSAVLAISGNFEPARALDLVDRYFGPLPGRPAADRPPTAEPPPAEPVAVTRRDPLAPVPALAVAWRCPPPGSPEYRAALLAASVLGDPESGRLRRVLVRERALATQAAVLPSLTGQAYDARDPEAIVATAVCGTGASPDTVAAAVQEELSRMARAAEQDGGLTRQEVESAARRLRTAWYVELDTVAARARRLAAFEVLYADAEQALEAPALPTGDGLDQVRAAAAALADCPPAVLSLEPDRGAA